MHSISELKKSLKISGIFDIIGAIIYFVLGVVCVVLGLTTYKDIGTQDSVTASIVAALLISILTVLIFIIAIVLFIMFAISLAVGINSLLVSKKELEDMRKKRRGLIVSSVFAVLTCIIYAFLFVLSIASIGENNSLIAPMIISLIALVLTILNTVFKIKAASLLKKDKEITF